jgi:hypothetical protein
MISRLHTRLGTAGLAVAIVALIAALAGGAYAANGALTGKQKKEVEKIAKKFQGSGPQGAPGISGAKGDVGPKGDVGNIGPTGKSVFIGNAASCEAGGSTIEVEGSPATKKNICNGKTGFTETLPAGKTETGAWTFENITSEPIFIVRVAVSFDIPLAEELDATQVHYINAAGKEVTEPGTEVTSTVCLGSASNPTAKAGNFCVYAATESNTSSANILISKVEAAEGGGASKSGALIKLFQSLSGAIATGSWAVTAEEE